MKGKSQRTPWQLTFAILCQDDCDQMVYASLAEELKRVLQLLRAAGPKWRQRGMRAHGSNHAQAEDHGHAES